MGPRHGESAEKGRLSARRRGMEIRLKEAIVLAGGFGARLRQVVPDLPKPMAPIGERYFLEILLTSLATKGFCHVVLSLGYLADRVVNHFGSQFSGMDLSFEIEHSPLGTGGAVRQAVSRCQADHVFVFNGDTYLDLEVDDVESHWQKHRVPIIVARDVTDTQRYGRLKLRDGRVVEFSGKGISGAGVINAGCYVLPIGILNDFPMGRPFSLETDFFIDAVRTQRIDVFVTHGHFIDIGIPEDYARAQIELAARLR
jgi:D-glycero-alpha-D-manno-heptose 1-phosphate guanylyltransferase